MVALFKGFKGKEAGFFCDLKKKTGSKRDDKKVESE